MVEQLKLRLAKYWINKHCREREQEHVMKTAYIEELRMCFEKHRVYHATESFYLPSRFMIHNFEEIE